MTRWASHRGGPPSSQSKALASGPSSEAPETAPFFEWEQPPRSSGEPRSETNTQPTDRGGGLGQAEPWLGQFGDSLLVGANRYFEPVAERRADHAHALDDQACARG